MLTGKKWLYAGNHRRHLETGLRVNHTGHTDFHLIMSLIEIKDAFTLYYTSIFLADTKDQVYFCLIFCRTASEVDVTGASHLP